MMKKRIFRAILGVALAVLIASLVLIVGVLHGYFQDRVLHELAQATAYVAHGVENEGMDYLTDQLPRDDRITWVASGGEVLYDNWNDSREMEEHTDREEIREARGLGRGIAVRHSETMGQTIVYMPCGCMTARSCGWPPLNTPCGCWCSRPCSRWR